MLPWVVRVLGLVTAFSPVLVVGQEPAGTYPQFPSGGFEIESSDPGFAEPGFGDMGPQQGHAVSLPCYWTVSSRGLPQEPTSCASSQLAYFERAQDGCLQTTTREAMVSQFIPGVPICIFIHGSFVDAESHQLESAYTYNWIRRAAPQLPAHIIFYTWPSEARFNTLASANPIAVNQRGRWAENNAFFVTDLIAHLPPESPVCLVGHSHGARVTVATLHLIAGGQIAGKTYPYDTGCNRRYRAVLAAGAIDRNWLNPGERYDFAVRRVEGILNTVNRTDLALHFYPMRRIFSRKAIAVTGVTRWDQKRLGHLANKVIDYDVTERIGMGHFWPNYYEEPSIGLAISPYVYFTDCQLNPTYTLAAGP